MATHTQAGAAFRVNTPLGEDVLLLEGFQGSESVSRPFAYRLDLVSEDPAVDLAGLLEKPVSFSVRLADKKTDRFFHGHIRSAIQLGKHEELTSYEIDVVPWLWFLSLTTDCRIFQQLSALEIVEEIFGKYPDANFDLQVDRAAYPTRTYCVQYRESDLNFVSRLLEEEGIFYFFEHSESGHKLILADDLGLVKPCPIQSSFEVATTPQSQLAEDVITGLRREHLVNSTRVTFRDYDFLQPSNDMQASHGEGSLHEVYDYPGLYADVSRGERLARLGLEERGTGSEIVTGTGTCRTLAAGFSFALEGYYVGKSNQEYMVTHTGLSGSGGGYRSGGSATSFHAHFECVPTSVPFRPARVTPKPVVEGTQTAVVVGPAGDEIYTDEHGRVKVQFHWDRLGKMNEKSSCWIRVSHPWAGKSWGAVWLPRIGQEVIVDFLEGDPDRPIITGRVYNAELMHPYDLPGNKTQSGVKSRSTLDGTPANFNEIRMEDKKGEEHFYVHAEKDKMVVVENDRTETVGHDESIEIGNDRTETVGHDESIAIGRDRKEEVARDESIKVASTRYRSVGKSEQIEIGTTRDESVGSDETVKVGSNRTHSVGKDDTLGVGKKLAITAGDEIVLKTGKASITMKKSGDIQIKGKDLLIEGSGRIQIKASSDVTIKGSKVLAN